MAPPEEGRDALVPAAFAAASFSTGSNYVEIGIDYVKGGTAIITLWQPQSYAIVTYKNMGAPWLLWLIVAHDVHIVTAYPAGPVLLY